MKFQTYEDALNLLKPWRDEWGFYVHKADQDGGGGDGAQRIGMIFSALAWTWPRDFYLLGDFERLLNKLECGVGHYRRHPNPHEWTYSEKILSRDQAIPLIVAMGAIGLKHRLADFFWAHVKRFGFCQNTNGNHGETFWKIPDHFTFPHYLGLWLRAFVEAEMVSKRWVWLVCLVTDLSLYLATVVAVLKAKNDPKHSDDLNLTLILLQSKTCSTPFARRARLFFAKHRPPIKGTEETWGPASAMEAYFSPKFTPSDAPRIDIVYKELGLLERLKS